MKRRILLRSEVAPGIITIFFKVRIWFLTWPTIFEMTKELDQNPPYTEGYLRETEKKFLLTNN